jgi:hypothetical protein
LLKVFLKAIVVARVKNILYFEKSKIKETFTIKILFNFVIEKLNISSERNEKKSHQGTCASSTSRIR